MSASKPARRRPLRSPTPQARARTRRRRDQRVGDGRTTGHEVDDGLGEEAVALALRDPGVITEMTRTPAREDCRGELPAALEGQAEAGEHLEDAAA
jgi:hypothetical protein